MRRIRSGVLTEQIKLVDAKFLIKQYDTWVAAKDAELALIELEETAAEHGVVASVQPQITLETATTEMVDVLEIDVPEIE